VSRTGEHVEIFLAGPRAWNHWRELNPSQIPDLKNVKPSLNQRQMGAVNGGPVNLKAALLQDAFLRYATLSHADLTEAKLVDADVAYARFDNAKLKNADLTNAVLDHTDFANAVLNGAIIRGASLKEALNLTQEQINRCVGDAATVLPDYIERPSSWSKSPYPLKPLQQATDTRPLETDYSPVGELAISRRAKAIGLGVLLVPLAAVAWNFLPVRETVPSPSPKPVTTIDVTPDAPPLDAVVPAAKTVTPTANEVTAPITSDAPPSKTATLGAIGPTAPIIADAPPLSEPPSAASGVNSPSETAALPPRSVPRDVRIEWLSETVQGGHALSDASSVDSDETHPIAALAMPAVPESHGSIGTMPLESDRVVPITATPDALPSAPTIPEPAVAAPDLPQKETNVPDAPAPTVTPIPTPTPKAKKSKTAAKPAPVAKNTKGVGGAISDLLAGGL